MLWSDLLTSVRRMVFPEGEALNLVTNHNTYILDGIIDLQRKVERFRERNFTLIPFSETRYHCGATIIDKPDGHILRIYAYTSDDHCDPVWFWPTGREQIEALQRDARTCAPKVSAAAIGGEYVGGVFIPFDPLPMGVTRSESQEDKGWRSNYGLYAFVEDEIWLFPHIESYERIAVEWRGVKLNYENSDLVAVDRRHLRALELYLRCNRAEFEDFDADNTSKFNTLYNGAVRDLIIDQRDKDQTEQIPSAPTVCQPCSLAYSPASAEDANAFDDFVAFGDSGPDNVYGALDNTESVAALVEQLDPDFILHLGDAVGTDSDVSKISERLTDIFDKWVPENWWHAFGNHDTDDDDMTAALLSLFPHVALANEGELYYKLSTRHCDIFVLYTGKTGQQTITGADAQSVWLAAQVAASTATWKILALHKPISGTTSDLTHQLDADLPSGIDPAALGIDLVIHGHDHQYERVVQSDVTYLTSGLGGMGIYDFGSVVTGSIVRYNSNYGVVRVIATSTRLQCSLYTVDNRIIDTTVIGL